MKVMWRALLAAVLSLFLGAPLVAAYEEDLEKAIDLAVDARYEEALQIFQRLLRRDPDDPLLNYYAGITSLRLGRLEPGIAYLEQSIRGRAAFPQAYYWLGAAYLQKKWKEKARATVGRGLELFPRNQQLRGLKEKVLSSE